MLVTQAYAVHRPQNCLFSICFRVAPTQLFYSCFFSGFALSVQTEYILTACLVVFFFVLIATVALVIQIALLHKSLKKLKAKSHR